MATLNLVAAEEGAALTERRLDLLVVPLFSRQAAAEEGAGSKIPLLLNIYTVQMVVHGVRILTVPKIMVPLLRVPQVGLEQVERCMDVAMVVEAEQGETDKRQAMVVLAEILAAAAVVGAEATPRLAV